MRPLQPQRRTNLSGQHTASDMFLNKLLQKKRSHGGKRTLFRKYGKFVILVAIFSIIISSLLYVYSYVDKRGLLNVKEVEISGAFGYVNLEDIRRVAESNLIGKRYFSIDLPKTAKLLQENFPGAKNIILQRGGIGKIKIVVEERVPLAVLYSTVNNKSYLVDNDGYVLGEVGDSVTGFPTVRYGESVVIGSFVDKDIAPITLELLKLSEKSDLRVSSISYYPKYTSVYVYNGVEVRIGNDKNRENSMNLVSSLLKRPSNDGKKVSRIDLRFEKVIVSYD